MSLPVRSIGLIAAGILLRVSLGATLGVYVLPVFVPESLTGAAEVTTALASSRVCDEHCGVFDFHGVNLCGLGVELE